jgi:hypothetical protein
MTGPLVEVLARTAEQMPAARIADDIWRQGTRRHRRRRATALGTVLVVALLAAAPWALSGRAGTVATGAGPGTVPARFDAPWPWQQDVAAAPPGPAALLVSGSAGLSMGTWDLPFLPQGSTLAVVGRDGSYRRLPAGRYQQAGQDLLLSPDGRYIAGSMDLVVPTDDPSGTSVVSILDLDSGKVRRLPAVAPGAPTGLWSPLVWSPDGKSIVAYVDDRVDGTALSLRLLDTQTGTARTLMALNSPPGQLPRVAFSPDGKRLAVGLPGRLVTIDIATGASHELTSLSSGQQLAGPGAWSPDGRNLSMLTIDGCLASCPVSRINARTLRLSSVDAATGAPATGSGFDSLTGASLRLLGWRSDGDAVVVRYVDQALPGDPVTDTSDVTAFKPVGDVDLIALHPGGGRTTLLDKAAQQVMDIDVPADLIRYGQFGGPARAPSFFPLPGWIWAAAVVLLVVVAGLSSIPILVWLRIRKIRRGYRPHPVGVM